MCHTSQEPPGQHTAQQQQSPQSCPCIRVGRGRAQFLAFHQFIYFLAHTHTQTQRLEHTIFRSVALDCSSKYTFPLSLCLYSPTDPLEISRIYGIYEHFIFRLVTL